MSSEAVLVSTFWSITSIVIASLAWHCFQRWIDWKASLNLTDAVASELRREFGELDVRLKKASVETAKGLNETVVQIAERLDRLEFKLGATVPGRKGMMG